jgi:HTH-type transcriptional regulator / antitoxin HipB
MKSLWEYPHILLVREYSHTSVLWEYPHIGVCVVPSLRARKPQDVAAVIKAAREEAGWSQADLADRLAFSRDYMGDLESGEPNLYMRRLFRVLHELGITVTLTYGRDHAGS